MMPTWIVREVVESDDLTVVRGGLGLHVFHVVLPTQSTFHLVKVGRFSKKKVC